MSPLPVAPARATLVLVALCAGAGAVLELRAMRQDRAELVAGWAASGLATRRPEAQRRLAREPDPTTARLIVAHAVVADALDPSWLQALSPDEVAREAAALEARLRHARVTADDVLATRPVSWEAALVGGGVRLAAAARVGPDELAREPWRAWLAEATRLAPTRDEPLRLAALGELLAWPALGDADRRRAREVIARALVDEETRARLLPAWAATAGSGDELLAALPPQPQAWQEAGRLLAARGDWSGLCTASERARALRLAELDRELAEAVRRADRGDSRGARGLLLDVIRELPVDGAAAPRFERALALLPAGPVPPDVGERLALWVRWHLPLGVLELPALEGATLLRASELATGLDDAELALAALLAGDLPTAERRERRTDALWSQAWADYLLVKARRLAAGHDRAGAEATRERVHRDRQRGWAWTAAGGEARPESGAWTWRGGVPELETILPEAATVAIPLLELPRGGTAVGLRVDGSAARCVPVAPGALLRPERPLSAGPHRLEVVAFGPGPVVPGPPETERVGSSVVR